MSIREIAQNFRNFCPKHIPPLNFRVFPLLLPEFPIAFARISGKSNGKFGQKQWKFGQKQWENLGKSNEKTRISTAYISGKNYSFSPNFPLLFLKFPLLLPEFPTAFARNFRFHNFFFFFFFFGGGGGHSAPLPPPPPPPTPMFADDATLSVQGKTMTDIQSIRWIMR